MVTKQTKDWHTA